MCGCLPCLVLSYLHGCHRFCPLRSYARKPSRLWENDKSKGRTPVSTHTRNQSSPIASKPSENQSLNTREIEFLN